MRVLRSLFRPRSSFVALCWLLIAVLGLGAVVLVVAPTPAHAQDLEFHMDEYNADITVQQDGTLFVQEELVYSYDSGTFTRGLREIPLDRVEGIEDVKVFEVVNGREVEYREGSFDPDDSSQAERARKRGTFGTTEEDGQLRIRWIYTQPAQSPETKTFLVTYFARGAVRVYDTYYELDWYAVPPDWDSTIDRSTVRVTFPEGFDTSTLPPENVASAPSDVGVNQLLLDEERTVLLHGDVGVVLVHVELEVLRVGRSGSPNCGAPQVVGGKGVIRCDYCGAEFFLPKA